MNETETADVRPGGGSAISESPGATDNSQRGGQGSQQSRTGDINFNLGPAAIAIVIGLVLVIGACGVVIGLDISERAAMSRAFDERSASLNQEFERRANNLRRELDELTTAYKDMKTQYWLLERRLMDKEALDIIHGHRLPSDTEFGPTGNLQRMKPREK